MAYVSQVEIGSFDIDRFESVLDPEQFVHLIDTTVRALEIFKNRVVWNINSTARGGGVAEMLQSLLAYARGAAIDARWAVISGNPEFFRVTKRIHNHLHGAPGDGGDLGDGERRVYEDANAQNAAEMLELIHPNDVVIVHDPQPAGLIDRLKQKASAVVWRCHVGLDFPNDLARNAWAFLMPYVQDADDYVFSREAYAWEGLRKERISIIPPSIDAFAPKNQAMQPENVGAILDATRLVAGSTQGPPVFRRWDGTEGRVSTPTLLYDGGPPPPSTARIVSQVSRWDRLKDPLGVIAGFVNHVVPQTDEVHLIVAGPAVAAVSDDPEGKEVLDECLGAWQQLSTDEQRRVHLACLPMEDAEENAAIVNALQRRADVVVQKSLAEGFGLTVAEAMWKARPVVASRIGGIQDQIVHGESGLLVDDPRDLVAYGAAVSEILADEERADEMGRNAQERVRDEFLGARSLIQYVDLFEKLLG
ncbi:MAG: glycosyltransferase [Actinomycetota bacterium]